MSCLEERFAWGTGFLSDEVIGGQGYFIGGGVGGRGDHFVEVRDNGADLMFLCEEGYLYW